MSETVDRPLSHWIAVARMGFERDFHRIFTDLGINRSDVAHRMGTSPAYVSKVLNGKHGNFTLETMAKWARAIGAVVQVRLVKEGKEVVRVLDYETAGRMDDATIATGSATERTGDAKILLFNSERDSRAQAKKPGGVGAATVG